MSNIVLKKINNFARSSAETPQSGAETFEYLLAQRQADLSGTEYIPIVRLTEKQAMAISRTVIRVLFEIPPEYREADQKDIFVERVPEREPGTEAWQMRIGGDLVTKRNAEGEIVAQRFDDDAAWDLAKLVKVWFEPGQPDWELRYVEDLEDHAARAKTQYEAMSERARRARAIWSGKRVDTPATQSPEPDHG